jgi:porphobilinogen deaminase
VGSAAYASSPAAAAEVTVVSRRRAASLVGSGFARLDTDVRELRGEMNARFDALNRNLFAGAVAIVAAPVGVGVLSRSWTSVVRPWQSGSRRG